MSQNLTDIVNISKELSNTLKEQQVNENENQNISIPKYNLDKTSKKNEEKNKKKGRSKRCNFSECKKRLTLTDLTCRCGHTFCPLHFNPRSHNCEFDYKKAAMENLKSSTVSAKFSKLNKID